MKSSESLKNRIAEYQAHKTAVEVWISPRCVYGLFRIHLNKELALT